MQLRLSKSVVGKAEAEAVSRVITEAGYLGMGHEVQLFEEEIATYLGIDKNKVILVNTGTAALHLAVQATCKPGDEVLVPSLTFVASFQAISACNCKPVACEVLENTCTIDLEDAKKRLTAKTTAIMPVHYASNPWQIDEIYAFAKEHGLRVIEDAAHAFGCSSKNRLIGSFGDTVCFSFDGIKNITSGEGGCIIAHDSTVATFCKDARLLSVQNDTEQRYAGKRSWDFDVKCQGYRYHLSNIMAAIGRVQLQRLNAEFAPKRQNLVALYRQHLANAEGIKILQTSPEDNIVAHIFPVLIAKGRMSVFDRMAERGIPCGVHYKPNHLLSLYGGGSISLPVTERIYNQIMTLPLHPDLSEADIALICSELIKAVNESKI